MANQSKTKMRSSTLRAAERQGNCPALSPNAQLFVEAATHILHRWDGRTELSALQSSVFRLCKQCPSDLLPEFDACMSLRESALLEGLVGLRAKLLPRHPLLAFVLA